MLLEVLLAQAEETMLADAQPPQRSIPWCNIGGTFCELNLSWELFRQGWAVLSLAAVRAL